VTSPIPIPLDPSLYQSMRECPNCGGPRVFVLVEEIESGRVGFCLGCEQRVFVPFTRVTQEAA
jgi:hypothetical protein